MHFLCFTERDRKPEERSDGSDDCSRTTEGKFMRHLKEKHCHMKNSRLKSANFFSVCGTQAISYVVKETKVSESTLSIKTEHYELHKGRLTA